MASARAERERVSSALRTPTSTARSIGSGDTDGSRDSSKNARVDREQIPYFSSHKVWHVIVRDV